MSEIFNTLPNYRRAADRWPDAETLQGYVHAVSTAASGTNHGLVEHVKSFLECLCLTILEEFGVEPPEDPSLTELLVAALKPLGLHNTRGANKMDKVLSGFNKLADALSEMRNETGPVAHGKEGFLDALCADHLRAFLHLGDSITGLLLAALNGREPNLLSTREPYERFKHLSDRIDQHVRVTATVDTEGIGNVLVISMILDDKEAPVELRLEPSRLLYGLDRDAFVELMNRSPELPTPVGAAIQQQEEAVVEAIVPPPQDPEPHLDIPTLPAKTQTAFSGSFGYLRSSIESFVAAEGLATDQEAFASGLLTTLESNAGVDWQIRATLQAQLRIALMRFFRTRVETRERAASLASNLVERLRDIPVPTDNLPVQT